LENHNNAIQFENRENHPFMVSAITLGNTISYDGLATAPGYSPGLEAATGGLRIYNGMVGTHEYQHTIQGQQLGPLYLPSNVLGMAASTLGGGGTHGRLNWNRGPQSLPPRVWHFRGSYPY
jgi:hypothetical protein